MTGRIEKTVFISYRRTNFPWAYCIYQDLTHHGYDVFFDYQSIDSGNFEKVILENIKARAHFIVILSPSALERCDEPGDWLRREIEMAMDEGRNIIPVMLEGFDFGSPSVRKALTGKLSSLDSYSGMSLIAEYVEAGFEKLRNRFLNVALEYIHLHTLAADAKEITETQKAAANEAPPVERKELTAQEWFERGYVYANTDNTEEAIRCYSEALRLDRQFYDAYLQRGIQLWPDHCDQAIADLSEAIRLQPNNPTAHAAYAMRGFAYFDENNLESSITDFDKAISLKPDYATAYFGRGLTYWKKGDLAQTLTDFSKAIDLRPDFYIALKHRGNVNFNLGKFDEAIGDYDHALQLTTPEYHLLYSSRGNARLAKDDLAGALDDYNEAIRSEPENADAYYNRALVWEKKKIYFLLSQIIKNISTSVVGYRTATKKT